MAIKDAGMYFIHFLLTVDFLALNTLSAGNATSACSKVKMDTMDRRVISS